MSSLCVIVMLTDTAGCIGAWLKFLCTIHRLTDFFFSFLSWEDKTNVLLLSCSFSSKSTCVFLEFDDINIILIYYRTISTRIQLRVLVRFKRDGVITTSPSNECIFKLLLLICFMTNCDYLELKNHLLNWQTLTLTLLSSASRGQKLHRVPF